MVTRGEFAVMRQSSISSIQNHQVPFSCIVDGGLFHLNYVLQLERRQQNGSTEARTSAVAACDELFVLRC